jgi:hypothetical protein
MVHGSTPPSGFTFVGGFVQVVLGKPPIVVDIFRKN